MPWLYSPWNSLSQNTRVGSLSLLQEIFPTQGLKPGLPHYRQILYQLSHKGSPLSEVAQLCLTLCNPMDCSLRGSSILGIFQARVLGWVAISFSRGSSRPRNQTWVSCIANRCFYHLSCPLNIYWKKKLNFRFHKFLLGCRIHIEDILSFLYTDSFRNEALWTTSMQYIKSHINFYILLKACQGMWISSKLPRDL